MEEYRKLSWRQRNLKHFEAYLQTDFITEDMLKTSHIFKQFKENQQGSKADKETDDSDAELENLFNDDPHIPGEMDYIDTNRKSRLGQEFHARCIHALKVLHSGKNAAAYTPVEKNNVGCLQANTERIMQERRQYLDFVRDQWIEVDRNRVNIPQCLQTYAKLLWCEKRKKINNYPQYYRENRLFNFTFNESESVVDYKFLGNVLKLGIAKKFTKPTLLGKCFLKAANLPPIDDFKKFYSSLPVSQDINVDRLLQNGNIDIVISSSGLKCLVDTSDLKTSKWIIPVVIKNVEIKHANGSYMKKVVYLDKPLISSTDDALAIDLYKMCYKRIIKRMFCQYDLERYATDDKINSETACIVDENQHPHVNYDIWNIKKADCQNSLMKHRSKTIELNVLIRSKLTASERIEDNKYQPVIIRPKLELQLAYGASIASKSELAKEWALLFFTPFSTLYRMRLSPRSGELIAIEQCKMQKVISEAQAHHNNYRPQLGLGVLQKVFEELHQLEPGRYLLQHLPKHDVFLSILKECHFDESKHDIFNFHATNTFTVNNMNVPKPSANAWLPIDVNYLLPAFEYFNRIPGMFSPHEDAKRRYAKKKNKKNKGRMLNKAK